MFVEIWILLCFIIHQALEICGSWKCRLCKYAVSNFEFEINELYTYLHWFYQKFKTRYTDFLWFLVDFIQKWPNLCSASWNTIFFSRNQNCCNISPWASNKENLEYVVQYQKVICNLKIFSARSIFFGICPNLFWNCKRKKICI